MTIFPYQPQRALSEFFHAFGLCRYIDDPTVRNAAAPDDGIKRCMMLIGEESKEALEALWEVALDHYVGRQPSVELQAAALKELADLVYVAHYAAEYWGWDLENAFRMVHGSNMSKLDADGKPVKRPDGKILKGPNYRPPDLTALF